VVSYIPEKEKDSLYLSQYIRLIRSHSIVYGFISVVFFIHDQVAEVRDELKLPMIKVSTEEAAYDLILKQNN